MLKQDKNRKGVVRRMSVDIVVQIANQALYLVIKTAAPVLVVSLVIGLIVSIFQTVTSIQEQTLTFVPKIVGVFLTLMLLGSWMLNGMSDFMVELWSDFTLYIR
jgi:flagellar biosynthetic protein FliQ